jgi:hypothetical protein
MALHALDIVNIAKANKSETEIENGDNRTWYSTRLGSNSINLPLPFDASITKVKKSPLRIALDTEAKLCTQDSNTVVMVRVFL